MYIFFFVTLLENMETIGRPTERALFLGGVVNGAEFAKQGKRISDGF